jgi:hypothetical protein
MYFAYFLRLTHNQTRFLMSEFARQAHPDAAHRERLAREIPGLSPRQVQVWFQNRYERICMAFFRFHWIAFFSCANIQLFQTSQAEANEQR